MKKIASAVPCVLLTAVMLAGCGGGTDEYCSQIKDAKSSLGDLGGDPTSADFDKLSGALHDITDVAPDSIKDDWSNLTEKVDGLREALDDAGVKVEDLQDPSSMQDMDPSKLKKVTEAAKDLSSATDSTEKIQDQVKEECNIELG